MTHLGRLSFLTLRGIVLFLCSDAASYVTGQALCRGRRSTDARAGAGGERGLRRQGVKSQEAVPRAKAARMRNADRQCLLSEPSQ